MRKIVFHWERLSFGTLIALQGLRETNDQFESFLLLARAIDPLINGKSLLDRPIAEAQAIMAAFVAEGTTKIPEALAVFKWAMSAPQLPTAPLKDTADYTAQPGEKAEN